jgi:predicted metal-binding protein
MDDAPDDPDDQPAGGRPPATILSVCTRCNWTRTEAERDGVRGGARLIEAVRTATASLPDAVVRVRPVACMSNCKRACTVVLSAPGKFTLMFGDLDPDAASAEVVDCARLHHGRPGGFLARAERPPLLRAGILARIPPPEWTSVTGDLP